jgi:hypothetical protein
MATHLTESEWLTTKDPHLMLRALPCNVSSPKSRLLAAAFCRRVWHLLIDAQSREAVEMGERVADGAVGETGQLLANKRALHGLADSATGRSSSSLAIQIYCMFYSMRTVNRRSVDASFALRN